MKKKFIFASYFSICLLANTICNGNPTYLNENLSKQNAININALSNEDDYSHPKISSLSSLGNLRTNIDYYSNRYWNGLLENFLHYIPIKIVKYYGCYSHMPFIGKTALANGSAHYSLNETYTYEITSGETIYFKNWVRYEMESSMYSNTGYENEVGSLSGDMRATATSEFESFESNYYSSKARLTKTFNYQINLGQNEAKYCDDGYSMAIGWVGEFYVITYKVENVVCLWGDDKHEDMKEETVTIVDDSQLILTYVFLKAGDSKEKICYIM